MSQDTNQTTDFHHHIASPIPRAGGRKNLCGALQEPGMSYDGLDEAYRANVEGWASGTPCPDCLRTAMIAMGSSA